ncbi:MAG: phosphotransferase [Polyangiaceae bacterium]
MRLGEMLRFAGLSGRVADAKVLATGMLNTVYSVTLGDTGRRVVIRERQFQHPEYGQEFAAERFAYPLIEDADVLVPELIYVRNSADPFGAPFAIFEHIEGPTLDVLLDDPQTPQSQRAALLEGLAQSLASIHRTRGPGYGTLTSIQLGSDQRREFFQGLFAREDERLARRAPHLAPHYRAAVARWLDRLDQLPRYLGEPRLVHGDVHGRNVIVGSRNRLFFIDWEASRFRIAPYDLGQLCHINFRHQRASVDQLLRLYAGACGMESHMSALASAVEICRVFWLCRMALFQMQFPEHQDAYFGCAEDHLREVESATNRCLAMD